MVGGADGGGGALLASLERVTGTLDPSKNIGTVRTKHSCDAGCGACFGGELA